MAGEERRVGVAVDFSTCSLEAVKWAVENVVREGDYLILVTIRPHIYYEEGEMQLWETTGSPLIPLNEISDPTIMKKYGVHPDLNTLEIVNKAVEKKKIVVVMKIFWGDPREKICEAVDTIPLSSLVVGSRGLGKIKRAIMGSVSNYVVGNAPCPVTVVKNANF
ncbi:universal stress protein PHOS32-like [Diospyros lotus]|uniref:universal stress protein PHOS32-like n=1 Tax=Diospyros lotus TaxID=55363 RepID=UPI0022557238|nr:universal stress protein PHOS32-like [Diospyros lotus]